MTKEEEEKVVLRSGQTAEDSSSQQTEGESTQESAQTQQTVLDPERVSEARTALDPFYRRAAEEGAVRAFLDTYAKPDPADVERTERAARRRKQAAVLAESLRLISDMGTGFAGGNVYDRGGAVTRDVQAAEGEAQRAREKYDAELERFNAALLGARQGDMARRDALDRMALQYGTRTESTSTGKSKSSSSTHGSTESRGSGWQEQQARGTVSGRGRGGGGGKGGRYRTIYRPTLLPDGKIGRTAIEVPEDRWEDVLMANATTILKNPELRKRAVERAKALGFDIADDKLPDILMEGKVEGEDYKNLRETLLSDIDYNNREMMDILTGNSIDGNPFIKSRTVETTTDSEGNRVRMPGSGTQQIQTPAEADTKAYGQITF